MKPILIDEIAGTIRKVLDEGNEKIEKIEKKLNLSRM